MRSLIKRVFVLLAVSLVGQEIMATDWFPVSEVNNRKYSISIGGGAVMFPDNTSGAVDISTTIWGGHLNIIALPAAHSKDVSVDKQKDKTCFAIHAGYQIPITKAWRVIPLVGYASVDRGYTDGSNYRVDGNGIHNSFVSTDSNSGFDYGGSIVFNYKMLIVSAAYTKHTAYASIGLEF
jgi:hypothetical protein